MCSLPFPSKILTVLPSLLATARSALPSPSQSATAIEIGFAPAFVTVTAAKPDPATAFTDWFTALDRLDGHTPAIPGCTAQISTRLLASGTRSLRAVYPGIAGVWPSSRSSAVNQSVNAVAGSGFAAVTVTNAGANPISIAVADFDGDGKADLAVANNDGNTVSILLGNGNEHIHAALNYPAGVHPN